MANNPYANKVIYGNQTIMDLSQDTVVASDVMQGKTFHDATGALLTGTYTPSASGYTIHIFTEDSNLFGNTVTITKDDVVLGTTTIDNTGNATFNVQQTGTYVVSTIYQGTTYQNTVEVVDEFSVELSGTLDGKTVLPTDDIQIWLKCADIRNKAYTTLAEVLADTDTLATLMASENAVDYLVRSTTWAVAQALVPTMTSDNTPAGVGTCGATYVYTSTYAAHKAFDKDNSTCWSAGGNADNIVYFTFPVATKIQRMVFIPEKTSGMSASTKDWDVVASNDNFLSYDVLYSGSNTDSNAEIDVSFNNSNEYLSYGLKVKTSYRTGSSYAVTELQFYNIAEGVTDNSTAMSLIGANDYASNILLANATWNEAIQNSEYFELVDNTKVPVMTSNTTPKGVASATMKNENAYLAFDENDNTRWQASGDATVTADQAVMYEFDSPITLCMVEFFNNTEIFGNNWKCLPTTLKIQSSNDGVNYTDIKTSSNLNAGNVYKIPTNLVSGKHFRAQVVGTNCRYGTTAYYSCTISKVNFYGRQNGGVQTWLRSAGITDKLYTTIEEVLLDTTTLAELIANHDAMDYLVTTKAFIDAITSNQTAMSYIGNNNYAANTLLADEVWCSGICNSEYFKSVLNLKVPKMTSNTTPEGICSATLETGGSAYQAFDENLSTYWGTSSTTSGVVYYEFTKDVTIYVMTYAGYGSGYGANSVSLVDGNDNVIKTQSMQNITGEQKVVIGLNNYSTKKYGCRVNGVFNNQQASAMEVQFYGREDIVEPEPSTEMVLYEDGTQYIELSNKMSGITNSAVFQSSYIQCSYYSTNACGFSSVSGFDIEGYKSLKVRFKLANNDSYVKVLAADLETNFLNKGVNSVKLGFGYGGNVATLYLKDAQYSVTTSDYWASTVSGGSNYIAVDKIWLE